jgi:Tfp pilus assembly protein PilN
MSVLSSETGALVHTGYATLPRVNLLPPEIGEARRFRRIQYGLCSGVALTAAAVALLYVAAVGSVGDASTELQAATAENTRLQSAAAEYADVTAVYARAAAADGMLTEAMGQEVRYSELLGGLSLSVPENVWLRSLSFGQAPTPAALGSTEPGIGTMTVSGVGLSHEDVAVWLESLAGQTGYTNPSFSTATEALIGERTVIEFTSTATLTPEALSREYTTPAGG